MSSHVKELVAVPHGAFVTDKAAFKQLVMMFERIAIQDLIVSDPNIASPEFTWLAELGILIKFDMEKLANDDDYRPTFDQIGNELGETLPAIGLNVDETVAPGVEADSIDLFEVLAMAMRLSTNVTRLTTSLLRKREHLDAYAVIPSEHSSLDQDDQGNHDVAKIVLPTLPVPDDDATWQQILEYRNGPNPFSFVKNWISDVARGSLTPDEAEERIELLLNQYRTRLETHQMKTTTTTLEAFVVTTADVLDRFRPGERPLFSVEHRKMALLQGESTSAGSEVAYVIKTKPLFPF
jgi:hypothetical protein